MITNRQFLGFLPGQEWKLAYLLELTLQPRMADDGKVLIIRHAYQLLGFHDLAFLLNFVFHGGTF
jgi:hypothetical protein